MTEPCIHRNEHTAADLERVTVRLPGVFWTDHEDRGLVAHGADVAWTPSHKIAVTTLTRCDLADLLGDARHYCDDAYADYPGLRSSAKATIGAIERAGFAS